MQEGGLGVGGGEIKGEKEGSSKHSIRFSRHYVVKIVCASLLGFTHTHRLFQEGGLCFG